MKIVNYFGLIILLTSIPNSIFSMEQQEIQETNNNEPTMVDLQQDSANSANIPQETIDPQQVEKDNSNKLIIGAAWTASILASIAATWYLTKKLNSTDKSTQKPNEQTNQEILIDQATFAKLSCEAAKCKSTRKELNNYIEKLYNIKLYYDLLEKEGCINSFTGEVDEAKFKKYFKENFLDQETQNDPILSHVIVSNFLGSFRSILNFKDPYLFKHPSEDNSKN